MSVTKLKVPFWRILLTSFLLLYGEELVAQDQVQEKNQNLDLNQYQYSDSSSAHSSTEQTNIIQKKRKIIRRKRKEQRVASNTVAPEAWTAPSNYLSLFYGQFYSYYHYTNTKYSFGRSYGFFYSNFSKDYAASLSLSRTAVEVNPNATPALSQYNLIGSLELAATSFFSLRFGGQTIFSNSSDTNLAYLMFGGLKFFDSGNWDFGINYYYTHYPSYQQYEINVSQFSAALGKFFGKFYTKIKGNYILFSPSVLQIVQYFNPHIDAYQVSGQLDLGYNFFPFSASIYGAYGPQSFPVGGDGYSFQATTDIVNASGGINLTYFYTLKNSIGISASALNSENDYYKTHSWSYSVALALGNYF